MFHARELGALHADKLNARLQGTGGDRHAGQQPAAADRDDHGIKRFVERCQHLKRNGALTGNHIGIVERVDEGEGIAGCLLTGKLRGLGQGLAVQDHLCAEGFGAGNLGEGRILRHDDGGRDAELGGMIGDPLGMVASRHRNDACFCLFISELLEFVQSAALFERGGALEVFQLGDYGAAQMIAEASQLNGRCL